MGTLRTYCLKMRGLLVLAFFVLFAEANGHGQLVRSEQCHELTCPAGCCPDSGWVCCPNLMYCAATFAECPLCPWSAEPMLCDGRMCGNRGCCGNAEGWTCADKPADCSDCPYECPDWLGWVDCPLWPHI